MERYVKIVMKDPAVEHDRRVRGRGYGASNQGRFFIMLKPLSERGPCQTHHFWQSCPNVSADDVINRLRGKLAVVPGATLYLAVASGPHHRRALRKCAIPIHSAGRRFG